MHAHCIGTGQYGASLSILKRTIGKEKRVVGSEAFQQFHTLTDITASEQSAGIHISIFHNEVFGVHIVAHECETVAGVGIAQYRAVL